jgi:transcription elongation GreA/GreB family factor
LLHCGKGAAAGALDTARASGHLVRMSVAFTREEDSEAAAADLPDRPISQHPNLVTPEGLAQIEAELASARAAYTAAQTSGEVKADRTAMARATRDLRYYSARRASAQLVEPPADPERVAFGVTVRFEREDGREQTFRIVGEDEADPANGSVSYVSPLASALMGREVGDTATVAGREVEIVAIA